MDILYPTMVLGAPKARENGVGLVTLLFENEFQERKNDTFVLLVPGIQRIKDCIPKTEPLPSNKALEALDIDLEYGVTETGAKAIIVNHPLFEGYTDCSYALFEQEGRFSAPHIMSSAVASLVTNPVSLPSNEGKKAFSPEVVHINGHHMLLPYDLLKQKGIPSVLTFHGIVNDQDAYALDEASSLGIEDNEAKSACDDAGRLRLYGHAIKNVDALVPVSPTYAKELLVKDYKFGFGVGSFVITAQNEGRLKPILNGISADHMPEGFQPKDLVSVNGTEEDFISSKLANKLNLQKELGLEQDKDAMVCSFVHRLEDSQKGVSCALESVKTLLESGKNVQLVLHGNYDYDPAKRNPVEEIVNSIEASYPGKIKVVEGYNEKTASQVYAASDVFLAPSQFEPCGLSHQLAMLFGAKVVALPVGGLNDTITEKTGYVASETSNPAFLKALGAAHSDFQDKNEWSKDFRDVTSPKQSTQGMIEDYMGLYAHIKGIKSLENKADPSAPTYQV